MSKERSAKSVRLSRVDDSASSPEIAATGADETSTIEPVERAPRSVAARPSPDWAALSAVVILLVAFAIRTLALGERPLQPDEAQQSFNALAVLRGGDPGASPLLTFSQALVFLLFGVSDVTARLVPALAGTALVALPLLLTMELGVSGSRAAMLMLAVSPTLVHYSRNANPAILVAALLALFVVAGMKSRLGSARWAGFATVALGLLLATGPLAFVGLAAAGVLLLLWLFASERGAKTTASRVALPSRGTLLFGVGAWLIATTGGLTNLGGIQSGAVDGFGAWLAALVGNGARPTGIIAWTLGVSEALPIALVAVALVGRTKASSGLSALVALALLTFGFGALGVDSTPVVAALIVPPLALAGGVGGARLMAALRDSDWRDVAGAVLVGGVLLAGATIAVNHVTTPQPYVPDLFVAVPIVVIVGVTVAFVVWREAYRAIPALAALAVLALFLFTWRATALDSLAPANPDGLYAARVTSPDVRALARDVDLAARAKARQGQPSWPVVLSPSISWPSLWYLRDVPGVAVREPGSDQPAIVIAPAGAKAPKGSYAGQSYVVAEASDGSLSGWKSIWRWLAYRETSFAPRVAQVVVFVRGAGDR